VGKISSAVREWGLLAFGIGVVPVCGCRSLNPQIVWLAESKSPDGRFVVTARAYANDGFGTDGVPGTFVYLNWAEGSQKPLEIMEFTDDSAGAGEQKVELRWLAPNQLEIGYNRQRQQIQFQAVRFVDVCIGTRDTSSPVVPGTLASCSN
jgi:hypothetical protein